MPKAFRTDVISHQKFEAEVARLKNPRTTERVRCPVDDCACTYEMFGSQPAKRAGDVSVLQGRLKGEHPGHTSEVLGVNQFRKGFK